MPIQDGKYVTPAWQNGGPPAITAEELTAIGQSLEQDQTNIKENAQNIASNTENLEELLLWKTTTDPLVNGALQKSGGTMTGIINMGSNKITGLQTPSSDTDAVNLSYLNSSTLEKWEFIQTISVSITATPSATKYYNINDSVYSMKYDLLLLRFTFTIQNMDGNSYATSVRINGINCYYGSASTQQSGSGNFMLISRYVDSSMGTSYSGDKFAIPYTQSQGDIEIVVSGGGSSENKCAGNIKVYGAKFVG